MRSLFQKKNKLYSCVFILSLFFLSHSDICSAHIKHESLVPPKAAIASAEHLATEAGFEMLRKGGNAFDAAVAVGTVLAVVEPHDSGLGGGGFYLIHQAKTGKEIIIDARERAPTAAHHNMYLDKNGNVIPDLSINGPLSAAIPGEPAAFVHLAKNYGRLPLKTTLAPAINLAWNGFIVNKRYHDRANMRLKAINASPAASNVLLINNNAPEVGEKIVQKELANTFEAIAEKGNKGFYSGVVAKKLVKGIRAAGGNWTLQDLKDYKVIERKPLRGNYKGIELVTTPPPSANGISLMTMLNILSEIDLHKLDSVARKHFIIETMRRAYYDRAKYLGDADYASVPIKFLMSKHHAKKIRNLIQSGKVRRSDKLKISFKQNGSHTTHYSIVDQEGNWVGASLSLNYYFGSGFMVPGTGVLLNNEMDDFSAKPGVPNVYGLIGNKANSIAPGKRPLSSMGPVLMKTPDKVAMLGTTGGSMIITSELLSILDFAAGNGPESWVSLPRYHHQYLPDQVLHEADAFSSREKQALKKMGHRFKDIGRTYGDMHAVMWDKKRNIVVAASDPRGVGVAKVGEVKRSE